MGTYAGPEIATDGLVFCSDMSNTQKSWRGPPTTNSVPSADTMPSWNNYYRTVSSSTFITEFGTTGYRFINQPSWNGIARGISIPSTGTYTFSAWFRYLGGSSANNGATVYISGWGGGDSAIGIDKTKIGIWQRISITLNCTTTSMTFYIISYGGTDNGTGNPDYSSWEVTMPQVEPGSSATPFVSGTRSNTQALVDVTGQNTITANSLTYNSDGTFTFATGVNYCTISNLDSLVGNVTLEAVVNLGTANGPHQTAICTDLGYRYGIKLLASYHSNMAAWAGFGSTDYLITGPVIQNTGNNHICLTRSSSTGLISLYRNGALVTSGTTTTGNMSSAGSAQGRLGLDYHSSSYGFNGRINLARAYNRVLTADEVFQNFSATRTLYGL